MTNFMCGMINIVSCILTGYIYTTDTRPEFAFVSVLGFMAAVICFSKAKKEI